MSSKDNYKDWEKVGWKSPSNIALVKYWGKRDGQIPQNPSLSMTLSESFSETSLYFKKREKVSEASLSYYFEGIIREDFQDRIKKYLGFIEKLIPGIRDYDLVFESKNSFPHSAGIASSAASFSSIALCLCSMEQVISKHPIEGAAFFEKASDMARLGSGSACRSVYGEYVSWGFNTELNSASNFCATKLEQPVGEVFQNLHDSILIIDDAPKEVSSSLGHSLLENHPYAGARFAQASKNYTKLLKAFATNNFDSFAELVEEEAMSIHSLMMTSNPSFCLMKANTLIAIEKLKIWREKSGVSICFTLDAGPNIHILYPEENKKEVTTFIDNELKELCTDNKVIHDKIGSGPVRLGQ